MWSRGRYFSNPTWRIFRVGSDKTRKASYSARKPVLLALSPDTRIQTKVTITTQINNTAVIVLIQFVRVGSNASPVQPGIASRSATSMTSGDLTPSRIWTIFRERPTGRTTKKWPDPRRFTKKMAGRSSGTFVISHFTPANSRPSPRAASQSSFIEWPSLGGSPNCETTASHETC